MPHWVFSCSPLAGGAGGRRCCLPQGLHTPSRKPSIQRGLSGVSDPSFCLPSCLETPMLWPPPPLETTAPSPRNQRHCDISPVAKGTTGTASPVGSLSAAALVVTSPRFWQLAHAAGSDAFAPAPHPAGPVLACARRLGQLWVSGRGSGRELGNLMGFPGGCLLVPRGHTTASSAPCGSLGSSQHPGCWHNSPAGLKQKRGRPPTHPTGLRGLTVHAAPRGEGRRLTFSRDSSEP